MNGKPETLPLVVGPDTDTELIARYRDWLGVPVVTETPVGLALALNHNRLSVIENGRPQLHTDFTRGSTGWRLGHASIKREALARACGLKHGRRPCILDATAGLGHDGLLMAQLGCNVTLIERSPSLAALLDDALCRAQATAWLADAVARVQLVLADACDYLGGVDEAHCPDVVYLDPMFEPDRRRGAASKGTALLERLAGRTGDGDALLEPARGVARERVVVKRHRRAEPLARSPADFRLEGRSTRFDGYLSAAIRQ